MFTLIKNVLSQIEMYLVLVGIISSIVITIYVLTKISRAVRVFIFPRLIPLNLTYYGKWAVVTGGSSGIGKSYALQFASRGMNLVIISNELEALKSTAEEIEDKHCVQCSYIHADFTRGKEVYENVVKELSKKDIGILLNAAGIPGNAPCYFLEETKSNILAMIDLHIIAVMCMTLKILPSMLAKNRGIVVNISSGASFKPIATYSIYSSCKAFSDRFTRALYWEYKDNNREICFQSVTPFVVATRMTEHLSVVPRFGGMVPKCDTFVAYAVNTIGTTYHTTGYWIHELNWFVAKFFPDKLIEMYCLKSYLRNNIKRQ